MLDSTRTTQTSSQVIRSHLQGSVDDEVHRSLTLGRVKVVDQRRVVHDQHAIERSCVPTTSRNRNRKHSSENRKRPKVSIMYGMLC